MNTVIMELAIGPLRIESFKDEIGYANTLVHEVVHSTGRKNRLKRTAIQEKQTENKLERYSLEELVAELGAAMVMAKLGIKAPEHNDQSIAYFKGWLSVFKENKKIIPIADAQSKKALSLIEKDHAVKELKKEDDPVDKMRSIINKAFDKHGSRLNKGRR